MGQILDDTLSQIYENLGEKIENLSVQCIMVGYFHGRKAKQWCLRRELHSAKILSASRLLSVVGCDNAKFRQHLWQNVKTIL